jgi:hypothetical protein
MKHLYGVRGEDAEQTNACDFCPLSPISTYSSRLSFWWQFQVRCPSSGVGQSHVIVGVITLLARQSGMLNFADSKQFCANSYLDRIPPIIWRIDRVSISPQQ